MKSLIGTEWREAKNNDTIKVINPATNELIDTVPSLSAEEVEEAINYAYEHQKEWENVPVLFMANTQDINHVLPADVVKKKFGEIEGRKYLFHETYSYDGEGIKDGIDWLINSILNK